MKKLENRRILVVDDEPDLQEILKDELEIAGAQVFRASSGNEALALLNNNPIDCIVSDMRMSDGDGMSLLKALNQINTPKPVFILLTGFNDYTNQEAYDLGAKAVLQKPCDLYDVINAVHDSLIDSRTKLVRKFERVESDFMVELQFDFLETKIKLRALNIGLGGMFISLSENFPSIGERVYFTISYTDQTNKKNISGLSKCKWVRKSNTNNLQTGIGLEFVAMNEKTFENVQQLVTLFKNNSFIPMQ